MERLLMIGQLAQATSVPAKTIRYYYEQVGILPVPRRSASGYRQYTQRDVHWLLFIRRARALGLSLASLTALTELAEGSCLAMRPRLTRLVTEHLCTVRQQIAEFQLLERQLTQILRQLLTGPPRHTLTVVTVWRLMCQRHRRPTSCHHLTPMEDTT